MKNRLIISEKMVFAIYVIEKLLFDYSSVPEVSVFNYVLLREEIKCICLEWMMIACMAMIMGDRLIYEVDADKQNAVRRRYAYLWIAFLYLPHLMISWILDIPVFFAGEGNFWGILLFLWKAAGVVWLFILFARLPKSEKKAEYTVKTFSLVTSIVVLTGMCVVRLAVLFAAGMWSFWLDLLQLVLLGYIFFCPLHHDRKQA